jgi:hypothetical protein
MTGPPALLSEEQQVVAQSLLPRLTLLNWVLQMVELAVLLVKLRLTHLHLALLAALLQRLLTADLPCVMTWPVIAGPLVTPALSMRLPLMQSKGPA